MRGTRRTAAHELDTFGRWTTELLLIVSHLGAILTISTLGTTNEFFAVPALFSIGTFATCALLRALGARVFITAPVVIATGLYLTLLVHFGDTFSYGFPSSTTREVVGPQLRESFLLLRSLVPPIEPTVPFTAMLCLGNVAAAVFSDTAAFETRAPALATAPPMLLGSLAAMVSVNSNADVPTMLTAIACVSFVTWYTITKRARWNVPVPVQRTAVRSMTMTALVGLLLASTFGYGIVRSSAVLGIDQRVDLREIGRGEGPRTVISPLVSVQGLINSQSNSSLFSVVSDQPHYWRLTSLNEFDGVEWHSSTTYNDIDVDEPLPQSTEISHVGASETVTISYDGLRSDWVPAPFVPRSVSSNVDLRYDKDSASILVADPSNVNDDLTFNVTSSVVSPESSRRTNVERPDDSLTELPASLLRELRPRAELITARATNDRERARALQDYFRDSERFTYDKSADYTGSSTPIRAFLEQRIGFCQQFATAYAAFARSLGMPTRVAVGFTYGQPNDVPGSKKWFVSGKYAHAWPEVWLDEFGWIPFEPTPNRGNPDAVEFTGINAQQDSSSNDPEITTTTEVVPTTLASEITQPPTTVAGPVDVQPTTNDSLHNNERHPIRNLSIVVILGLLVIAGAVLMKRSRRTKKPQNAAETVARAWDQIVNAAHTTNPKISNRLDPTAVCALLDEREEIRELVEDCAFIEILRRYADRDITELEGIECAEKSEEIVELLRPARSLRQKRLNSSGSSPSASLSSTTTYDR